MKKEQAIKAFAYNFDRLARSQDAGTVFNDFLDFALWMVNPFKDEKAREQVKHLDTRYKESDSKYMVGMFEAWIDASDDEGTGFCDALGDFFMENVSHGRNGQYFTPQPICQMMSEMMIQNPEDGATISDPACGSGRMLLAAARINRKMLFYGADNSEICCKMAALNMIVNTMTGEIAHMNSLTMEHWKSWHIKRYINESGFYIPYYYTTGPNTSTMTPKMVYRKEEAQKDKTRPAPDMSPITYTPPGDQLALF